MSSNYPSDSESAHQNNFPQRSAIGEGGGSLEGELWSLDDDDSAGLMPAETLGAVGDDIPPAKLSRVPRVFTSNFTEKIKPQVHEVQAKHESSGIKLNVRLNQDLRPNERPARRMDILREFGDLEQWADDGGKSTGREMDEAENLAKIEDVSVGPVASPSNPPDKAEDVAPEESFVEAVSPPVDQSMLVEVPGELESAQTDVSSEVSAEIASRVRPRGRFSAIEKFGIIAFIVLLLGVVGGVWFYSATRLPVETIGSKVPKFPIKGQYVTIRSAKTYWRDVIASGPDADIVRRGTRLLPVLDLTCSDGAGVLRILFRDEFGDSVGDIITKEVSAGGQVSIASTAGFNDLGMHAAYRTGGTKAWKIEVFEGNPENFSGNDFQMLFEIDISTERR